MRESNQLALGDLIFALAVNFLLYSALILVFYMLIRFYLEEEYDEILEIEAGAEEEAEKNSKTASSEGSLRSRQETMQTAIFYGTSFTETTS